MSDQQGNVQCFCHHHMKGQLIVHYSVLMMWNKGWSQSDNWKRPQSYNYKTFWFRPLHIKNRAGWHMISSNGLMVFMPLYHVVSGESDGCRTWKSSWGGGSRKSAWYGWTAVGRTTIFCQSQEYIIFVLLNKLEVEKLTMEMSQKHKQSKSKNKQD